MVLMLSYANICCSLPLGWTKGGVILDWSPEPRRFVSDLLPKRSETIFKEVVLIMTTASSAAPFLGTELC